MSLFVRSVAVVVLVVPALSAQDDPKAVAAKARAVFKQHCHECHSGGGSVSGYGFDVLKDASLKNKTADEDAVVVPGKPAESRVYIRLAVEKNMPPKKGKDTGKERPNQAEMDAVKKWIELGAPAYPSGERRHVPLVETLTAIGDHLRKADSDDRNYLRYFTLTHLHNNNRDVEENDLRLARAALSKAVNSMSWRPGIVVPEAVDKERTVYAVDVRKLDWDRGRLWSKILSHYPYGLRYRNHQDRALRAADDEVMRLSGGDLPYVRADWFLATATRPPLYHDLMQIPKTAGELEYRLGVDVRTNYLENKLWRGGFSKSGVSNQNRLVERHDANSGGAYWKSYDFKPESGRAKLTRFPLGPLNLFELPRVVSGRVVTGATHEHPFPNQAFKHDGGEVIFGLPNGLQGYMLLDGKDNRIDAGPIDVVSDLEKTSGTPAIVTGVSCMACHVHGSIAFKDTIRTGSAVFGKAQDKVERLYPDAKTMDEMVEADGRRFMDAMEKAVGKTLREGDNKDKPLKELVKPEPVGLIAHRYRIDYLDLKKIALELDVAKPEDLVQRVGERRLKELGLEALLRPDGVVGRLEWEAVEKGESSVMQLVARALGATPMGP